jgi:hypothetical protein
MAVPLQWRWKGYLMTKMRGLSRGRERDIGARRNLADRSARLLCTHCGPMTNSPICTGPSADFIRHAMRVSPMSALLRPA